jgi:hypothetical protein
MADERMFADIESLRPLVRTAFGRGRPLLGAGRLAGSSKKGAYSSDAERGQHRISKSGDSFGPYGGHLYPRSSRTAHGPLATTAVTVAMAATSP